MKSYYDSSDHIENELRDRYGLGANMVEKMKKGNSHNKSALNSSSHSLEPSMMKYGTPSKKLVLLKMNQEIADKTKCNGILDQKDVIIRSDRNRS